MKPNGFLAGEWTVYRHRNLLVRGDEHVRVEPRVMEVLVYLADRAGQVVSKEELVEQVWRGRYVTDDVLTVTIYALRKALGDDARRPKCIETVSRRGYMLVAPVTPLVGGALDPSSTPVQIEMLDPSVTVRRKIVWGKIGVVAILLAVLGAFTVWVLGPSSRSRRVASAESHEAYVKGRFFLDQRSIHGWRQALEHFERAVALDPQDPAAHAGLADTYSAMSDFGVASPTDMRPRAIASAKRALELDPDSAEGHAALGRVQFLFDWDFVAAERSLRRALTLNPDYMPAYQAMAWLKSARGQYAEATAAAKQALQLDPVNTARYNELAWVLALGGHYEEALNVVDRGLQLNPRSFETHVMRGWTLETAGRPDQAFASYREALRVAGVQDTFLRRIESVYRVDGLVGYYRNWLAHQDSGGAMPMSYTWRAQLYVRAGQLDRAIESLEQAYEKREGALAWVNVEPGFAPLRPDRRFQQIAARIKHD